MRSTAHWSAKQRPLHPHGGRIVGLGGSCRTSRRLVVSFARDSDKSEDSSDTQDALVDMLRSNINRIKAVETLGGVADAERMKLIKQADDVRAEIEKASKLNRNRSDLAFSSAQADINQQFAEIDAELKAAREKMEADLQGIHELEEKMMRDRQEGLLFKSLYGDRKVEKRLRAKALDVPPVDAERKERRLVAQQHTRSLRLYLFVSLAAISLAACVSDVVVGPAKTWQALLYAALAISIAITAGVEKAAARDIEKELRRLRERRSVSDEQQ